MDRVGSSRAWIAASVLFAYGCASAPLGASGYCAPPSTAKWSTPEEPARDGAPRAEQLAALIGVGGLYATRARGEPLSPEMRAKVLERLETGRATIAATSAELDCEGERAEQAANRLAGDASRTVQEVTIASLLVAAATAIAGVFLSTKNASPAAQDATAIGGGAVTVSLGLASLYVRPTARFNHARNPLRDVWNGPATSDVFPPVVWGYLTRPAFSNAQRRTIRENVVARWRAFEAKDDPKLASLLTGDGGDYDVDALRARAAMLDQMKAEVELENQDLADLGRELLR